MSIKNYTDNELEIELFRRKVDKALERIRLGEVSNIKEGGANGIISDPGTKHAYPDRLDHYLIYDPYTEDGKVILLATASVSCNSIIMGDRNSFQVAVRPWSPGFVLIDIECDGEPKIIKMEDGSWRVGVKAQPKKAIED